MDKNLLISSGALCFALLACSTAADPPAGQAGASSVAGSAGTVASGGAPVGAAGSATAGAATAGDGAGGSAPLAGAGGSAPVAGAGGAAVGAGGTAPVVDTTLAGAWDGALLKYPCGGGNPNYDCSQPSGCQNATATRPAQVIKPDGSVSEWTMGGTPGTIYNVTVHIRGVVEASWYHGGDRSAGNTTSIDVGSKVAGAKSWAKDLFQVGGTTLTYADNGNGYDYNQYELDITPPGGEVARYFLNSVIPSENAHVNGKTTHLSFEIDEMPTLKIAGGAKITLTVLDSNCVQIQNCGTSNNNMCGNGARVVTLGDADPKPPTSWTGKVTSGAGGNLNGQFVHFDVVSVTVGQ